MAKKTFTKPEIQWVEKEVKLTQLIPFERNPRKISDTAFNRLVDDIKNQGYHRRLLVTRDYRVIGGHQRIKAFKKLGLTTIKVLLPSVEIPDTLFRELMIKDNLSSGEFDLEILHADYTPVELEQYGIPAYMIPAEDIEKEIVASTANMGGFFVMCTFENENDQQRFFEEMRAKGIVCKLMD